MKQIICCLVLFSLLMVAQSIGATEIGPLVRIRINHQAQSVSITSPGDFRIISTDGTQSVSGNTGATFQISGTQVRWNEKGVIAQQFIIKPDGREFLSFDQKPYRGELILRSVAGSIQIINRLELDDYIKGTMKLETNPAWPVEALKAQIVVARTFALRNLGRNEADGYDFCSTYLTQSYGGVKGEDPRTNRLIDETKNLILTYLGEPADSVYHSQSGGVTEDARYVWGTSVPYLISVPSPWETDAPHHSWEVTVSTDSISRALSQAGLARGHVLEIESIHSKNGGRVKALIVHTDRGSYEMPAQRFREALGFQVLPSTFFELERVTKTEVIHREVFPGRPREASSSLDISSLLEKDLTLDDIINIIELRQRHREQRYSVIQQQKPPEPIMETVEVTSLSEFIFRGRGYGHGVGLSQWGSRGMALAGYGFEEILRHYYPGCEVRRARFR